ncbi:NADP-dependent oxidoreductase [Bradyrhizobium sp. BRP22]|uniref:NADP-dependent oxidoreductase n=1 Tax=Bradyrhizobium sp. BRP22 TaxID=2793821 RepID=UPI001CD5F8B3|nr:NADP-dependent oxidoreductase [Bradyrhizobium sp. BRP22]
MILLKRRPTGMPCDEDFERSEQTTPELSEGEALVKTLYLSLDPYMRGIMDQKESYIPSVNLGEVMRGHVVGVVVQSRAATLDPGDHVHGMGGWQAYSVGPASTWRKIDTMLAPLPAWLGPLGLPGWTAHVGLMDLGSPKPGETVVVSSAAGAVGTVAGQLARIAGCRVVGIAGGSDKCRYVVDELGFHACVDYKAPDFDRALAAAVPSGIDINFENVGGSVLDTIWPLMNRHSRLVVSGLIAQYNQTAPCPGPDLTVLLRNRINIRGFIISEHLAQIPNAVQQVGRLLRDGQIKTREDIVDGLDKAPAAFIGMLNGRNFGKLMVRLAEGQ